jgi:hypothetical protein
MARVMEQLLNRYSQIAVGSSPNLLRLTAFDKLRRRRASWKSNRADYCSTERRKAFTFHHPVASFPSVLLRRETNEPLTLLSAPSTSRPHLLQLQSRHFDRGPATSDLPPGTDIVSLAPSACLKSAENRTCGNGGTWRKADVHAQQHLVVDKHKLEMESVGDR